MGVDQINFFESSQKLRERQSVRTVSNKKGSIRQAELIIKRMAGVNGKQKIDKQMYFGHMGMKRTNRFFYGFSFYNLNKSILRN